LGGFVGGPLDINNDPVRILQGEHLVVSQRFKINQNPNGLLVALFSLHLM
jgi:hypothetical protein